MKKTQLDSYKTIKSKSLKRAIVLNKIKENNGLTLFELVKVLKWPINSISGRVTELCKNGDIFDSGITRVNPNTKKRGIVWKKKKKLKP